MKPFKSIISLVAFSMLSFLPRSTAQIIYFSTTQGQIYTLNVATCTTNFIASGTVFNDMAVTASGLVYALFAQDIWLINPAAGTQTFIGTYPQAISPTLELGQNGQLYLIDQPTGAMYQVNPATGFSNFVGNLPSNWNSIGDLVYLDGTYYGTFFTPSGLQLADVNLTNPAASTLIGSLPAPSLVGGASIDNANCPRLYWFNFTSVNTPSTVWQYDVNSDAWTQICPGFSFSVGGADTPNNYNFPLNCSGCTTNAGNVTAQNFTFCGTTPTVNVPFTGGQTLDQNDLLRYILFTNLTDPEGSILLQSATPTISFNPATMTTGQTYYLGTVAGNGLNGSVDLADPCLDFSNNFATVLWRPLPTVSFSVANPSVCAGQCQTVTASFTGNPPFSLTYASPVGGQQTQAFAASSGSFQICLPANFSSGDLSVAAVSVSDANCSCQ